MPRNWNTIVGGTTIQDGETVWLNPNGVTWESHKFATTKADVGLSNVDNTSDANKPVSILTQSQLDTKANTVDLAAVAYSGDYIDLSGKPTLGTAASQNTSAFATASQGTLADSAVQHNELEDVAFSGEYTDLNNLPTIPAAQVNSDWNATSGVSAIVNKPTLSSVATSGDYNDLSNKPTIPSVPVQSVNGKTGAVVIDSTDVGADAAGSAADALNDANSYTDSKIDDLATVASTGSYNDLVNKPTIPSAQVNADWNATTGVAQILNKPSVPKTYVASGTVTGGVVTFNISSAGFTSLTQAGCSFRVNDDDNTYSFRVTSISTTSVTVSTKLRQFTGVTLLGINVIGSVTMAAVPNGTTVYATFIGS